MTGYATDTFVDMDAVVEIDEAGQIVDPCPLERFAGAQALPHRVQHRAIQPDLGVAVHADLGGRNSGEGRFLDGGVTVPAVDTIIGHMVLVAEGYRLDTWDTDLRDVRGVADAV